MSISFEDHTAVGKLIEGELYYNWLDINNGGGIMFFEVDWIEEETGFTKRVFRAKDFDIMYRAIKHMNIERQGMNRPAMKGIRIQALAKYDGEYSDITGNFDHDMALDSEERMA